MAMDGSLTSTAEMVTGGAPLEIKGECCARVVAAADHVLGQCADLISRTDAATLSAPSRVLPGGTIGKHLRHMIDHFAAAADAAATGVSIDYDHRERNVPMERDPGVALAAIASVRARLRDASIRPMAAPVAVRVMLTGTGEEAELRSSAAREIFFAMHHAVHHQAMMRAIASEMGMVVDVDFGKAPSTLNYERRGSCEGPHA